MMSRDLKRHRSTRCTLDNHTGSLTHCCCSGKQAEEASDFLVKTWKDRLCNPFLSCFLFFLELRNFPQSTDLAVPTLDQQVWWSTTAKTLAVVILTSTCWRCIWRHQDTNTSLLFFSASILKMITQYWPEVPRRPGVNVLHTSCLPAVKTMGRVKVWLRNSRSVVCLEEPNWRAGEVEALFLENRGGPDRGSKES